MGPGGEPLRGLLDLIQAEGDRLRDIELLNDDPAPECDRSVC